MARGREAARCRPPSTAEPQWRLRKGALSFSATPTSPQRWAGAPGSLRERPDGRPRVHDPPGAGGHHGQCPGRRPAHGAPRLRPARPGCGRPRSQPPFASVLHPRKWSGTPLPTPSLTETGGLWVTGLLPGAGPAWPRNKATPVMRRRLGASSAGTVLPNPALWSANTQPRPPAGPKQLQAPKQRPRLWLPFCLQIFTYKQVSQQYRNRTGPDIYEWPSVERVKLLLIRAEPGEAGSRVPLARRER